MNFQNCLGIGDVDVDVVIDHGKIYSLNKFYFNEKESNINYFSRIQRAERKKTDGAITPS